MKKFFWALMLAFVAVSFVACDKDEPKEDDKEVTVCDKCGQDPCVCEDEPTEEVCEECGKNPCECEDEPASNTPDWCDYYFSFDYEVNPSSGDYVVDEFDFADAVTADGKTIWQVLGYETFDAMSQALGLLIDRKSSNDNELVWYGYDATTGYDIETPGNTNGFGHWYSLTGTLDAWATETVRCYVEFAPVDGEDDLWIETDQTYEDGTSVYSFYLKQVGVVGIMPGNQQENETFASYLILQRTFEDESVIRAGIQFNYTVAEFVDPEAGEYNPANRQIGEFEFDVEGEISVAENPGYKAVYVDISKVQDYLQLTKWEVSQAIKDCELALDGYVYSGIQYLPIQSDGTEGDSNWVNAEGMSVPYMAEDAVLCFDYYLDPEYFEVAVCYEPAYAESNVAAAIGKTINFSHRFMYIPAAADGDLEQMTQVTVNYAFKVVE